MTSLPPNTAIAVAVAVRDSSEAQRAIRQFVVPDGIDATLFLLDVSLGGSVPIAEGYERIRGASFTMGDALGALAERVGNLPVVLRRADASYDPNQLSAMVEAFAADPQVAFITTNIGLTAGGQVLHVIDPAQDGSRPPQCWDAGLAIRGSALPTVTGAAWFPAVLSAYLTALENGRTQNLDTPYAVVSQDTFAAERFPHFASLHLIHAHKEPFGLDVPWLSIVVPYTQGLEAASASLEALFHQVLPGGTFEVVAVDRGDGSLAEILSQLSFRQPCQAIACPNSTLGAALQAGVDASRGQLLLFLDETAVGFPDLAEQHIRAHRDRPGQLVLALGSQEYPLEDLRTPAARAIATASPTAWVTDPDGIPLQPAHRIDAGNLSATRDAVVYAGGFQPSRDRTAAEDLGWRLHAQGYEALAIPEARVRLLDRVDVGSWLRVLEETEADRVGLHADNSQALDESGLSDLTLESLEALLSAHGDSIPAVRSALHGLAEGPNLYALERVGGEYATLSSELEARATGLLTHLRRLSEAMGRANGLKALGHDSYRSIIRSQKLPLTGARLTRFLLVPTEEDEIGWLGAIARYLVGFGPLDETTLVVLSDPENGGVNAEDIRTGVLELTKRIEAGPKGGWADVQVAEATNAPGEMHRLMGTVDGWVPVANQADGALGAIGTECATPIVDVKEWEHLGTGGVQPLPLGTRARFRLLVWPDWSSEDELKSMFDALARPLCNREDAALIIRYDLGSDGAPEENLHRMAQAFEDVLPQGYNLEVLLLDDDGSAEDFIPRLAASVSAVGVLPSSSSGARKELVEALSRPCAADMMEVTTELFSMPPLPLGPLYVPTLSLH